MRTAKSLWLIVAVSLTCLATTAPAATDDANRLIKIALEPSPLEQNLRQLTDEIGGRVPGTPAMQRAVEWGEQAFRTAGADSVHTEEFSIPQAWSEGATELSVTATGTAVDSKLAQIPKVEFRVHAVSIAWAPALPAAKHVPIVDVGEGTADDFKKAGDISGKLLLVHFSLLIR